MFKELKEMIVNFKYNYGIKDKTLKMPNNVKKMGLKVEFLSLLMTIISLVFAFILRFTNMMIEMKLFLLGLILFMLYRGERILRDAFNIYADSEAIKFDLIFEDEIVYKASLIIGKTKDKVLKYDTKNKIYRIMDNESVLNTVRNYLENSWKQQIKYWIDVMEIISILLMLVTAIITNNTVPNSIFIPLILIFSIISFFSSAYINIHRSDYYSKHRKYNNEQSVIVNDLLRVPTIVNKDLDARINRFKKTVVDSNNNVKKFYNKMNIIRFIATILETLGQYGIIIFYVTNIKLSNLSLASIAEITATLVIVETAIGYIRRLVYTLDSNSERIIKLKKEEEDMNLILSTYHKVNDKLFNSKEIDSINIKPFRISYLEESKNDIPFTLVSKNNIELNSGEIAILYGPSGSGKSTFMNMITERISLEKNVDIPSTSRFLFYDGKLKFGSFNIYDELFLDEKPDFDKMEDILKNLNLWYEIGSNSKNVWQYFKEKKFDYSLSNGQKQRLILAKMLYYLDNNIDALILDEATSGLDDKNDIKIDAESILEYIVRYANKDKKRIIVIATHQNIDGFKNNIKNEFKIKNFSFIKKNDENLIVELKI